MSTVRGQVPTNKVLDPNIFEATTPKLLGQQECSLQCSIQYVTWVINEIIQNLRSVFSHDLQCSRNGSHEYIKVASHTLVI